MMHIPCLRNCLFYLSMAAALLGLSGKASAAEYRVSAYDFNGVCNVYFDQTSTTAELTATSTGSCLNGGTAEVKAKAGPYGAGAYVMSNYACCGTEQAPFASGSIKATLRISGPSGVVDTSLNLVLWSQYAGLTGLRLDVGASPFGAGWVGLNGSGVVFAGNTGVPLTTLDCQPCNVTTKTIPLETNRDYELFLLLQAGGSGTRQLLDAYQPGLKLPETGPVLNLPTGYSATIDGMNVVDNAVVPPVVDPPDDVIELQKQALAQILQLYDQAVFAGGLAGTGSGSSATGRLGALRSQIRSAIDKLLLQDVAAACTVLGDAVRRTDGLPDPPDFVIGTFAPSLAGLLSQVRVALFCPAI